MKRKLSLIFLLAILAIGLVPVGASAGCFQGYLSCNTTCAGIADATTRTACGLDCNLELAGCVRHTLLGV